MSLAGHVESSADRIEELVKSLGYSADEKTHTGSTRSFTMVNGSKELVVRLKETGAKIDIFHGVRDDKGNRIHDTWRITSERKLEEVLWKITSATHAERTLPVAVAA